MPAGDQHGEMSGSAGGTRVRADALPRLDAAGSEPTETAPVTAEFDTSKPNIARVYDVLLGGKDNYAADRELARQIVALNPGLPGLVRDNRTFIQPAQVARSLIAEYAAPLAAGSAVLVSVFSAADEEFSKEATKTYTAAQWHSHSPAELERWLRDAGLHPLRGHVGNVSTWPLAPPDRTPSLAETIGDLAEKLLPVSTALGSAALPLLAKTIMLAPLHLAVKHCHRAATVTG